MLWYRKGTTATVAECPQISRNKSAFWSTPAPAFVTFPCFWRASPLLGATCAQQLTENTSSDSYSLSIHFLPTASLNASAPHRLDGRDSQLKPRDGQKGHETLIDIILWSSLLLLNQSKNYSYNYTEWNETVPFEWNFNWIEMGAVLIYQSD